MIEENDIAYCCTVLDNLYKELTQSMYKKSMQISSLKNIIEDYNRYLSRKNNPLQKAELMADYFNDDGRKLFAFYNDLLKSPKNICPVTIHGDLHARNILANGHGSYLIDFDWVDNGHVAKDFTLLECTILYMILPDLVIKKCGEHIRLNELESLHKQLYANFLLKTYSKIVESPEKDKCYAKAFEVIKTIRKYVEQVMNDLYNQNDFKSSFEEYKYSLILISLSQISFQDVNLEILVHTANSIIDSLE
jgi:5-methylthioribose kinase